MDPKLILASKILDHLIEGTTIEPTGHMNSRRIHTFGDLAKAMNKLGLVPKSGEWSGDSSNSFSLVCDADMEPGSSKASAGMKKLANLGRSLPWATQ